MDDDEPSDDVEPVETEGQRQARGLVEGLAVALLGAGVNLAMPGAGGAALGAATGSLLPALDVMRQRARDRVERTVEDGVARAELSAEDFAAWVGADPRHGGLLLAVVEAAARSTAEVHLDALARVLADGVRDDARVDVDTLAARALSELGPAHLQVLLTFGEARSQPADSATGQTESTDDLLGIRDMARDHPHLTEGMSALVSTLAARGCIVAESGGVRLGRSSTTYRITDFGRACLAYLDDRASGLHASSGQV